MFAHAVGIIIQIPNTALIISGMEEDTMKILQPLGTVLLALPTQLHVATLSTNTLRITWNGVHGEQYELWRLANNPWTSIANEAGPYISQ